MVTRRQPQDRSAQYEDAIYRELIERLGANARRLREERDITQEDAAVLCEMDVRVLQLVENRRTNPTFTTLARLARGFKVDPSSLVAPLSTREKMRTARGAGSITRPRKRRTG